MGRKPGSDKKKTSSDKLEIGRRLKIFRIEEMKVQSLDKFEEITGVLNQTVSQIENGYVFPSGETCRKLMEKTEINMNWLLWGQPYARKRLTDPDEMKLIHDFWGNEGNKKVIRKMQAEKRFNDLILGLINGEWVNFIEIIKDRIYSQEYEIMDKNFTRLIQWMPDDKLQKWIEALLEERSRREALK